ncbi:MAG: amidohydrolase family protein, partial [Alcanivoracaceae bacterium]|nr:amidohydrolase family protein [Alcanivoracaceae bacterium]
VTPEMAQLAIKATQDGQETGQMNANVRSIIAYNTDSEITPTLKFNGILLAQPTPQGGLVSGLSSIVQLDAWNWQDAEIVTDDAVHVNWPSSTKAKFDFSTFTVKVQENKDYAAQLEKIKSLFQDAKSRDDKQNNQPVNLKLDAVAPVFSGSRKVYIHTNASKSIIESINFFQKIGVNNVVLVAGQEVEPIIGFIKQSGVPVIVNSTHNLPKRKDSSVDAGYTAAIKLHKAGVMVAIANSAGSGVMSARNLAFTAGTLVNYGMEKEQALQLITGNSAKILGIDKNYGTLEVGKSATLIITEGDALDMRTNILDAAYIDGRKLNLDGRQQKLNQRYLEKYKL